MFFDDCFLTVLKAPNKIAPNAAKYNVLLTGLDVMVHVPVMQPIYL